MCIASAAIYSDLMIAIWWFDKKWGAQKKKLSRAVAYSHWDAFSSTVLTPKTVSATIDLYNHNTQHVTTSSNNNDDMNWTALNQAPPQSQFRCYERPFLKNLARTTSPLPLSVQSSCPLHATDSCFASFLPWPFVESELVVRNDHRHWTSRSRRRIRKWQTSFRNRIQTETIRYRQTLLRLLAADAVSCVRYCFRRQC